MKRSLENATLRNCFYSVAAQRCGQSLRSFPHTSSHSTSWRRPGQEGASQGGSTEALSTALERTTQGPPCSVKQWLKGSAWFSWGQAFAVWRLSLPKGWPYFSAKDSKERRGKVKETGSRFQQRVDTQCWDWFSQAWPPHQKPTTHAI